MNILYAETKVKKMGYDSMGHYLIKCLPTYGQEKIAKILCISQKGVSNLMESCGIKHIKERIYTMEDPNQGRIKKEPQTTTEQDDAIKACFPAALDLVREKNIPFYDAMNIVTVERGLRKSLEWILEAQKQGRKLVAIR